MMPTENDVKRLTEDLEAAKLSCDKQLMHRAITVLESVYAEMVRRGKLLQESYSRHVVLRHENNRFRRLLNVKTLPLIRNTMTIDIDELIDLHNAARKRNIWFSARSVLLKDAQLCSYAAQHANAMATAKKLTHSSMKELLALGFSRVGENIAVNNRAAEAVMALWLKSAGHRQNILNRAFNRIGAGAAESKNGRVYWCVCFGRQEQEL